MQTLQTCFHRCMEIGHVLFIVNFWSQYGGRDIALLIFESACMTYYGVTISMKPLKGTVSRYCARTKL